MNETEKFIEEQMESLGSLLKEEVGKMCQEFRERLSELQRKVDYYHRLKRMVDDERRNEEMERRAEQRRRLAEKTEISEKVGEDRLEQKEE